jgi:organic radical activating enzyme
MSYYVNEIFYSLQGEGMRAGEASIFLRFSGCNVRCTKTENGFDCDTEFLSQRKLSHQDVLDEIRRVGGDCRWVVLTGGEPGLQADEALVQLLHIRGYRVAIETNGSIDVNSPKVAEHAVKQLNASEVKYVRGLGQGIPKPSCKAKHKLISPAANGSLFDTETIQWCIKLVRENPDWRLSLQQHKLWGIR